MKTSVELENEIKAELKKEPLLERAEINVKAVRGIITLTGTVEKQEMKTAAKTVVRRIPGVKSVIEKLVLSPPLPAKKEITKSTFGKEENIIADTAEKNLKISGA